jgi:16S rRNA (guanine527-N7)-methyltransferase
VSARAASLRRITGSEDFAEVFKVSREITEKLEIYAALLRQWQKTINLVAPSTLDDVWHRHFADSAQLITFAPPGEGRWLDVGSGAGFPGMVLAILRSEISPARSTLIESDTRKAAFLAEVGRKTGVAVDILPTRIEITSTRVKVDEVQCVTARALAPLPRLLGLVLPYYSERTIGMFLKGREVAAEIEEARKSWDFSVDLKPSLTDPEGRVALIGELRAKTEE